MPSTLCILCTTEENEVSFPTIKEFIEHEKSGHTIMPKIEAVTVPNPPKTANKPQPIPEQPKKEPIILEYRFKGTCEICNGGLDTIKVEMGDKDTMIAYCPSCRKQWTSQIVIPINLQSKQTEKKK